MDEKKNVEKRGDVEKVEYKKPMFIELGSIKAHTFGSADPADPGGWPW